MAREKVASERGTKIPYARHWIDQEDIDAVTAVLRSNWITTGPAVRAFEEAISGYVGAGHGVAVSSGTAALHAATYAVGIHQGDEVIVPSMTFAATANAVVFQGGRPVFADVQADTLLIDPADVEAKITPKTKAIITVDYTGHPCDYDELKSIAERHDLKLIADSCHSLGAEYRGTRIGTLSDLTVFSFHPVKHITTGEGGMVVTDDPGLTRRMRIFRNHGITTEHRQRSESGTWYYEMVDLGYNYRITDFQCALGMSQLRRLPDLLARRREIASSYDEAFAGIPQISPLLVREEVSHAYHLYVVRVGDDGRGIGRDAVYRALRSKGIGANVHYVPVHLHPFYQERFGTKLGMCSVTEAAYEEILTLPLFPQMSASDVDYVITSLREVLA